MVHDRQALAPARRLLLVCALAWPATAIAHGDVHVRIEALDGELALHPEDAARWIERGKLHGLDGAWPLAARDFERAHELAPASVDATFHLARARLELGAHEPALLALDELARIAPDHPEGMELRGRALDAAGRHEEAAAAFSRAIEAQARPGPGPFLARARSLERAGQIDRAVAGLESGVARLGPVASLIETAHELEAKRGHHAQALAWIDRFEEPLRRSPRWLAARAETLHALGRETEAVGALDEARAALGALPDPRRTAPAMQAVEARVSALDAALRASAPITPPAPPQEGPRGEWVALPLVAASALLAFGLQRRRRRTRA